MAYQTANGWVFERMEDGGTKITCPGAVPGGPALTLTLEEWLTVLEHLIHARHRKPAAR